SLHPFFTHQLTQKTSLGRQKIKVAKIEINNHLQVTFSKRRYGLFRKASELCTLCGVEIAITVFSPAGKAFSFGHPSVDTVVDRYLSGSEGGGDARGALPPSGNTRDFNRQFSDACKELEEEKKRRDVIEEAKMAEGYAGSGGDSWWWDEAMDGMALDELAEYGAALEELMKNVTMRADDLMLLQSSNSLPAPPPVAAAAAGGITFHNSDMEAAGDESLLIQNQLSNCFDYENYISFPNGFGNPQL
ncbi:agamous-like mads-box protein agl61, partial [Phtheirospermum japonicum]